MAFTVATKAALDAQVVLMFEALEIELGGDAYLRLLRGSGEVSFAGRTFRGEDPNFGIWGSVEEIVDGVDDEAPAISLVILPPTNTAAAMLADPTRQGNAVRIWQGCADVVTGAVIPDPDLVFLGELDVATYEVGERTRSVRLDVVSAFERFFEDREGVRLNATFHQSIWPAEKGLEFVVDVTRQLPWGQEVPRPSVVLANS